MREREGGRKGGRERERLWKDSPVFPHLLPSPPAERSIYSKFQVAAHAIPCRTIVPGNQFPRRSLSLSLSTSTKSNPLREFMRQQPPPRRSDVRGKAGKAWWFLFLLGRKKLLRGHTDPRPEDLIVTRQIRVEEFLPSHSIGTVSSNTSFSSHNDNEIAFARDRSAHFAPKREKVFIFVVVSIRRGESLL